RVRELRATSRCWADRSPLRAPGRGLRGRLPVVPNGVPASVPDVSFDGYEPDAAPRHLAGRDPRTGRLRARPLPNAAARAIGPLQLHGAGRAHAERSDLERLRRALRRAVAARGRAGPFATVPCVDNPPRRARRAPARRRVPALPPGDLLLALFDGSGVSPA